MMIFGGADLIWFLFGSYLFIYLFIFSFMKVIAVDI